MKIWPSILAILLFSHVHAEHELSGMVFHGHTNRPIENANVKIGRSNVDTDVHGKFKLSYKEGEDQIIVHKAGFHDYRISLINLENLNNCTFYLTPIPERTGLKVSKQAVGVYEPSFEFIFDYYFIDNHLIIGSYLNRKVNKEKVNEELKNCALSLFDRGVLLDRQIIADNPSRFRRTPFNELFLEGVDYAFLIGESQRKIEVTPIDYKTFLTQVLPWTVAFDSTAFLVKIMPQIPQVNHFVNFASADSTQLVRSVKNKEYFGKTFGDYTMLSKKQKLLAKELSNQQGFPEQYYASYIRATDSGAARSFRDNIAWGGERDLRIPYSPPYKIGNEVFIFDCMNQWIFRHSKNGAPLDSCYFQIQLPKEEIQKIEQDQITQKVYAIHEREGVEYIRQINPTTGALGSPMKIAHPFPKRVKIYNGEVFYIREDAKRKIKHLYKETLDFP